jgi:MYXO-CTERM domain-containing protein
MRFVAAALVVCIAAGGALGIAPPVDPVPPKIVSFTPPPKLPPGGGHPQTPPVNTPEPASLTIMGLSLAGAGAYRLLRRRRLP